MTLPTIQTNTQSVTNNTSNDSKTDVHADINADVNADVHASVTPDATTHETIDTLTDKKNQKVVHCSKQSRQDGKVGKTTHQLSRTIQASSNLYQTKHGWQMLVALPQINPDSIELETKGHQLHLKASTPDQATQYVRQITFPTHVRWGEMNASWHHGLLKVDLTRADVQSHKIEVQVIG